jgi:hypothetical protein
LERVLIGCALLFSTLAQADVDPAFAKLRDEALKAGQGGAIESLGAFLDKYVGDCGGALGAPECQENAKAFRKGATGKLFYLVVNEDSVTQLAPGPYNPRGELTINLTPFFPAGGYALTHGAPRRADERGNPIMSLIPVRTQTPEDWNGSSLSRFISMRAFRLQLVFTPQDVWSLPRPGGEKARGVKAKIHAILITSGRTGQQLALWKAP